MSSAAAANISNETYELVDHVLPRLLLGPDPSPPTDRDVGVYPEVVTYNAAVFRELQSVLQHLTTNFTGTARGEVRSLGDRLAGRWAAWFETHGPDRLEVLERCAGPTAVAGRWGFEQLLGDPWDAPGPLWLVERAFAAFVEAQQGRPHDFHGDILRRIDLHGTGNEAVSATKHAGRADEILRLMMSRSDALPMYPAPHRLVALKESSWSHMLWGGALSLCFPHVTVGQHVVTVLPNGITQRIESSVREAGSVPAPTFDDASLTTVAETFAALAGDGLRTQEALETALVIVA